LKYLSKLSSVPERSAFCFFFSEGGSADYIVTGAWSAKAAKEVNLKKKDISRSSAMAFQYCTTYI